MYKTVKNRLGQLTISLPQLNSGKRLRGVPGVASVADQLVRLVPEHIVYCEHFAGSAKLYQELRKDPNYNNAHIVCLNDKSQYIAGWLAETFPEAKVTNYDFEYSTKLHDGVNTFHFYDDPWYPQIYSNEYFVFDRTVEEYYTNTFDLVSTLCGKWMIVGSVKNSTLKKLGSKYSETIIEGKYKIANGVSKVRVIANRS